MQPPHTQGNSLVKGPPADPLHDMISSERYIESLERKLNKVKGRQKEPSAKDMLSSLQKVKEDQMHHLLDSPKQSVLSEQCLESAIINKTHSGKQHNLEEIVAIVYQDTLSKEKEENEPDKA